MADREYWPQLDGVRAVAISSVVAYHLGYLHGGWVGVDVFFVLSGYLITTILLREPPSAGGFMRFWGRRARRLLPAVLLLLVVLAVYTWAGGPGVVPAQLRDPALATLFYVANWQQISSGHGYFAQFSAPNPLQHTWSLAIEEQYYLAWPLILGGLVVWTRHTTPKHRRRLLLAATVALAAASAVWMGVAAHLYGSNRAYLGTDTRAWELLLGGGLAMLAPPSALARATRPRVWAAVGLMAVAGLAAGISQAGGPPVWVWDGGLVAMGLCSALVFAASIAAPSGPLGRVLALPPIRWVGRISYSLYLWHWLVIVLMTSDTTGLTGSSLLLARLVTMLFASAFSYYVVERPLRRADWRRLARGVRLRAPVFAVGGVAAVAVVIVAGTVGPAGAPSAPVALPSATFPATTSPSSTTTTTTPPAVLTALPPASPGHPYRVWLIGDSVMADGSPGIIAALQATGEVSVVANTSFPGWGLVRDTGWPGDAEQVISDDHPQIVMGTWSWDDDEASSSPAEYLQRLETAMRSVMRAGDGVDAVVLLQFPQVGPATSVLDPSTRQADWARETQTQNAWDRLAQQAVAAFPGRALYLTTSQLFAPGGRFFTWFQTADGKWIRARKLDNTHFCPYGAAEFGALITDELTPILHLPPMAPGWETASWTHAARYNQPAGACPDDQPPPGYTGIPLPAG